jgi:lipoprotein-anchoring transpeptidase ErfK/SrfK
MNRSGLSTFGSILIGLLLAVAGLVVMAGTGPDWLHAPGPEDVSLLAEGTDVPPRAALADVGGVVAPTAAATPVATAEIEESEKEAELRIVVSTRRRVLWLVRGTDTIMRAPVAIGMNAGFEFNGKKWHFATPRGRRRVLVKMPDPVWTVPEWHYFEKAAKKGLDAIKLERGDTIHLADESLLVVTDSTIGRVNQFGYFAEITPGVEIIFDGKIFIPPFTHPQRRVADALGPYKLDMGDGYLIHGTHYYNEETIGEAVSHGCVRMRNEDLERLYKLVPRGTFVDIV